VEPKGLRASALHKAFEMSKSLTYQIKRQISVIRMQDLVLTVPLVHMCENRAGLGVQIALKGEARGSEGGAELCGDIKILRHR
jgi:hypothetical protein